MGLISAKDINDPQLIYTYNQSTLTGFLFFREMLAKLFKNSSGRINIQFLLTLSRLIKEHFPY